MSDTTRKSHFSDPQTLGSDVLIFSSDKGFINHHREILASIGFVPITATTVEAAIAVMGLMAVELVIVDEQDWGIDTRKILSQARSNGQSVPILVVSRQPDAEVRRQALDLGAAGYLDRPAFQDDVVRALLAHCARGKNPLWGAQQN